MAKKKIEKEQFTAEEAIAEMNHPGVVHPKGKTSLKVLWAKVEPILLMFAGLLGKKVLTYVHAFADAIDEIIADQENPDGE